MPEENKRQSLGNGDPIAWTKSRAATFVKDVEEIQKVLGSCDGSLFAERLSESLEHVSPDAFQTLKSLVSPFLIEGIYDERHCVRCHNTYTEKNNHDDACVVYCSRNRHNFVLNGEEKGNFFLTACCGQVYKVIEDQD
ncbi:hypothetical protein RhiJN_25906 [Ceratobasidium sp. AG-Ba]|nr:hypothetical protein RhiJN_25906 [Ceratobasidium sp. AG-Ba]